MARDIKQMQERINELTLMLPALSGDKLREVLNEIHTTNKQIRKIQPVYYGGMKPVDPPKQPIDERTRREIEIVLDRFKHDLTRAITPCESPIERLLGIWMYFYRIPFEPQRKIGSYRVDFCVGTTAVECDGFDYHDRTKEQATSDKQRDRDLKASGYGVLRFSGSEIWADPEKCAKEIVKIMREEGICQKLSGSS